MSLIRKQHRNTCLCCGAITVENSPGIPVVMCVPSCRCGRLRHHVCNRSTFKACKPTSNWSHRAHSRYRQQGVAVSFRETTNEHFFSANTRQHAYRHKNVSSRAPAGKRFFYFLFLSPTLTVIEYRQTYL